MGGSGACRESDTCAPGSPPRERRQQPAARPPDAVTSRLENTLGNYRQRASRLRDELEGIRRRFDALSASEIAGFLEELGADLDELGK